MTIMSKSEKDAEAISTLLDTLSEIGFSSQATEVVEADGQVVIRVVATFPANGNIPAQATIPESNPQ
jgi:hypothetical protein